MGGQPGKPKPIGNPPIRYEPQRPPIEEPPKPIPPPPGSAPGYQLAHHCIARYSAKVITGSVQMASVVHPR